MTTKPYNTTAEPTHHDRPHHRPVLEFVGLWIFAAVCAIVGVVGGGEALSMDPSTPLAHLGQTALGIVALLFLAAAVSCAAYARLEHGVAYGHREKATKTGDTWRIHLKREIPVGDRGTVDMEPDAVDLPVPPSEFVRIVQQMRRTGTSRDKRPAGVSQPLWRKIMAALEDLDGASKGPNGYELADDLDALLRDIARW